jgi:outer membrane biosynthesis protein TonB
MVTSEIPPIETIEEGAIPHFLMELQDDLARSRLREAFWISVIIHLILVVGLVTAPKYIHFGTPVSAMTAQQMINNQQLTYLDLPADKQQTARKPETNIISDKDRIAMSKTPALDKKTLQQLRAMRQGPPGPRQPLQPPSPSVPPAQQMAQGQQQAPAQETPQPSTMAMARPPQTVQQPKLEALPEAKRVVPPSAFKLPAGEQIQQAARAAAAGRAAGYGGAGGDYGVGGFGNPQHQVLGGAEILSDTMGVDFAPYLSRIQHDINRNWQTIIPEAAMPPLMKRGKVIIEFAITKDGKIAGMRLANGGQSGDVSLDRAAWGGITASNPFPPLPSDFHGDYIAIRCYFYYNPDKNEFSSR